MDNFRDREEFEDAIKDFQGTTLVNYYLSKCGDIEYEDYKISFAEKISSYTEEEDFDEVFLKLQEIDTNEENN